MAKLLNLLKLRSFVNAGDPAVEVSISSDTQPRLRIDAGGKYTWGAGGTDAGDTNLYRSAADTLKTDDYFIATGGLTVKTVEIDTASASSGQVLQYNGTKFVPANSGGASITISDTPPTSPSVGAFWFESDTGKTFIYYDSSWVEINGGGSGSVQETTLTTNSATTITRFDKTTIRSGEFLIQVTQGSKYTVSKILLIHNGTTPTLAEYGVIELGTTRIPLAISTSISGSDVLVQAAVTDAATTSAYVKVISSLIGL